MSTSLCRDGSPSPAERPPRPGAPMPADPRALPRLNRFITLRPTPRQAAFMMITQREALFGGAVGGGKSAALLMAALQYADRPSYSALIVRKTYPTLAQPGG